MFDFKDRRYRFGVLDRNKVPNSEEGRREAGYTCIPEAVYAIVVKPEIPVVLNEALPRR